MIYFVTCAMSTKHVESEAWVMSLVLIEGIAVIIVSKRRQNVEILSVNRWDVRG